MDNFAIAMLLASRLASEEVLSARPEAPVVAHVAPVPRARRSRAAAAAVLHRFADAVAPQRPASSCPA